MSGTYRHHGTGKVRPLPACPAWHGNGANIMTARFVLVADDCETGPDGHPTLTEIFGFFSLPGEEHDDDVLLTAGLDVPAGSPIAEMAHRVNGDLDRARTAGMLLRSNVIQCPCRVSDDCQALNQFRLLEAIERAAGAVIS